MRVPTYETQRALPTEGQGQILNLQLNSSAMEAPGRAAAAAGQQLAQFGKQVGDFAFKRAQIGAESEAAEAASKFQIELSAAQDKALKNPNMEQAAKGFTTESQLLLDKYKAGMSNSLARSAFSSAANKLKTQSVISFTKQNNARVLEARKTNLDIETQSSTKRATDITQSPMMRMEAAAEAVLRLEEATGDLGPEDVQARREKLYENFAKDTLSAYISKPGADVLSIVSSFRDGSIDDPIIKGATANLTETQRATIADNALKQANRIIKLRKDQREAASAAADADNDAKYNAIVNVNTSDPASLAQARALHNALKASGYYKTPDKRNAIDRLLGEEAGGSGFAQPGPAATAKQAQLDEKEALDLLTFDELMQSKGQVTQGWYSSRLRRLQEERGEGEDAAIDEFRDAFNYAEASDAQLLRSPARQAFFRSRRQIKEWIRENPKASKREIVEKAREIVRSVEVQFKQKMKIYRQGLLSESYSKLPASLRSAIPDPASADIKAVKEATAAAMANNSRDLLLNGFNKLLNEEVKMQLLD
jgi:hypothetical protein